MKSKRLQYRTPTDSTEREYYAHLLKLIREYEAALRVEMIPLINRLVAEHKAVLPETLRMDAAPSKEFEAMLARVEKRLSKAIPPKQRKRWVTAMMEKVAKLSKRNMASATKKLTGKEIEPLMNEKGLTPFFKAKLEENVDKISTIPAKDHDAIKNLISRRVTEDRPVGEIAKEIMERVGKHVDMTKKRAAFIARDQVNRLNAQLDQHRQTSMGVARYTWRTMHDLRVRGNPGGLYPDASPSHFKLDGKIFRWDKPPKSGTGGEPMHPGQPIGCRCYAEPVLDDLID